MKSYTGAGNHAMKMTKLGQRLTDHEMKSFMLESQIMRLLNESSNTPAVLRWSDMWVEEMAYLNETLFRLYMQIELCSGSLQSELESKSTFSEQDLVTVINHVRSDLCLAGPE